MKKPALAGLSPGELAEALKPYPPFRARQIYEWIRRGAGSFDEMSSLPLPLRKELGEKYALFPGEITSVLSDPDGTVKLGISLEDGVVIEALILRDGKNRKTACLSSQAGCPAGCVFCRTGMYGFKRNLTAREIIGQFLLLKNREPEISHIVIMGMGEPLLNLEEVKGALVFFTDQEGLNISKRRITLSTGGIVKGILDLAEGGPDIRLAFSLVSGYQELRERLMPLGRDHPLPRIKEALLEYQKKKKRRITLEIVLLGGVNTGMADAKAAADFAKGLRVVFNLIPWNEVSLPEFEGRPLRPPEDRETAAFAAALEGRGLKVTQRKEKGCSIFGACGQLAAVQK